MSLALAAAQAIAAEQQETVLGTVTVTAEQSGGGALEPTQGYSAKSSQSATKTDTPLQEIPQAVSVVTKRQMEDQQAQTVAGALNYVPGTFTGGRGAYGRYDNVVLRGFNDGMTTNQYLDGLRLIADASSGAQIQIDPYFLERIEVIRGPDSVIYGQTAPGGLIASTSKRPLDEPYHELFATAGYNRHRGAGFDFSGPLSDDVSYRVVGKGSASDTPQDFGETENYTLAPSLAWKISDSTRLLLQAYLQHEPDLGNNGSLPYRGTVVDHNGQRLPTSFYDGTAGDGFSRDQQFYGYQFEHDFNRNWGFKQNFRYQRMELDGAYAWQNGWNASDTALTRGATGERTHSDSYLVDNQLAGKFATGAVQHSLLAGLDYQKIDTDDDIDFAYISDLDPANPDYRASLLDALKSGYKSRYQRHSEQTGVYLQDQLALDKWRLTLGLRHDQAEIRQDEKVSNSRTDWSGGKLTKRLGLVYLADNGLAPYLSYSEGFNPSLAGYTDITGKVLKPTETRQNEVGIKYQPAGSNTQLNAALYELEQQNVARYNPTTFRYDPVGSVRSRGLELEAKTQFGDAFNLLATYTHTDMKITEGSDKDKTPIMAPKHMASLWGDYAVGNGIDIGAGVRYVGRMWADNANSAKLPSYTLLDMALRLDLARFDAALKGASLRFNAYNLLNKTYVASCYDLNSCYYGAKRSLSATVSYKW